MKWDLRYENDSSIYGYIFNTSSGGTNPNQLTIIEGLNANKYDF